MSKSKRLKVRYYKPKSDFKLDITDIKDLMGHEDIKTTERYVKSNPARLINACKEIR